MMRAHGALTMLAAAAAMSALLVGTSFTLAQEPPAAASPSTRSADPPAEKAREEAVSKGDDQKAKEAQQTPAGRLGTNEPTARTQVEQQGPPLIDGQLAVPGAPRDTETAPAKFSARNAALDALPMLETR